MSEFSISSITEVQTDSAPAPAGHYVQATVHAGLVYISGQLPVQADGTHDPSQDFEAQAGLAIENLLAILEAAGSSPERLLKVTAYVVGVEYWPAFNRVYQERLANAKPARCVVPVPELHYGYLVELDAIAALDP